MRLKGLFANHSIWIKGVIIVMMSIMGLCVGGVLAYAATLVTGRICPDMDSVSRLLIDQAILSTVAFIVAGWACIKLLIKDNRILRPGRMSMTEVVLPAIFVMVFSIPFINQLAAWNESMTLPESFEKIEKLMREWEDSANDMTMQFFERSSLTSYVVNIIVLALIPAIGEEMLFRGTIQQSMTESGWNKHLSVILTAAIFSAIHLQFYGFLPRFALGVILGYAFLWSGSLWVSALMHFVNNALVVTAAFAISRVGLAETTQKGMKEMDSIGTGGYITPCISLLLIVLMMLIIRRYYQKARA